MRNGWQRVKKIFRSLGQGNPRVSRWEECQLDVKMPSLKIRAKRRRPRRHRKIGSIRLLAILCLCLSIPIVTQWFYRQMFTENQEFKLTRIQIETDGALAESKIAETTGLKIGMDLMAVDIESVRAELKSLPNVVNAQVSREFPDRIHIKVKERIPLAWLSCPPQGIRPLSVERGFLIDEKGNVFRCLEMREDIKELPVIEALKIARPSEGTILESQSIQTAIEMVIKSESRLSSLGLQISEVRLKSNWAMECIYRNGLRATFSMHDLDRGLRDLADIREALGDREPRLATVNLVVTKNIPVTFEGKVDRSDFRDFLSGGTASKDEVVEPGEDKKQKQLRSILKGG